MQPDLKRQLLDAACTAYRASGYFHYRWTRGKLGQDPVFASLLEQGTLNQRNRVLDLGCGRGLLAAWFLATDQLTTTCMWPANFEVPQESRFTALICTQAPAQPETTHCSRTLAIGCLW